VQTDRTIPNSKPDIIIQGNERGTCLLTGSATSGDGSVMKVETILKYENRIMAVQRVWSVVTELIPVVIGATATVSKSSRK
jgi:hypothetical protein